MKGFIEVTTSKKGTKCLFNVRYIEKVIKSTVYFAQDYIECKESYEEIRAKIAEAVGEN